MGGSDGNGVADQSGPGVDVQLGIERSTNQTHWHVPLEKIVPHVSSIDMVPNRAR